MNLIVLTSFLLVSSTSFDSLLRHLQSRDLPSATAIIQEPTTVFSTDELTRLEQSLERFSPQGDWIGFLNALAVRYPDRPLFALALAQAHWRAGDAKSALSISADAMVLAPSDDQVLYRSAVIARTCQELDTAKERIAALLKMAPKHADGIFLLGSIEAEQGHFDAAGETLTKAILLQPEHFRAYYIRGQVAMQKGDWEGAVRDLQKSVDIYPFFREAYTAMRTPLARLKRQEDLKRIQGIIEKTRQWNPDQYTRLYNLFQNRMRISPRESVELVQNLTLVERDDWAKRYLESLQQAGRMNDDLRLLLSQLRFNALEFDLALEMVESIQNPILRQSETFRALQGWTYLKLGAVNQSLDIYNRYKDVYLQSAPFRALGEALNSRPIPSPMPLPSKASENPSSPIRFQDRTMSSGLHVFQHRLGHSDKRWITDAMGSGVAVGDYDNDGDDDIYFVNGRPELLSPDPDYINALFRNNDDGTFTDVTDKTGVGDSGYGMCAIFGDIDNDGWLDLFVGNYGECALYKNNGDGTFREYTEEAGIQHKGYAAAAAFGDVDGDEDLDLFVGHYVDFDPMKHGDFRENYHGIPVMMGPLAYDHIPHRLYLNQGNGHFIDASEEAGIRISDGRAMGAVMIDLDNDRDLDLYVTNDSTYNHVLRNQGDGRFEDISFESGAAFNESGRDGASMGVAAGDVNHDGFADLLITAYEQESDNLFINDGSGFFLDQTGAYGLRGPSLWLTTWGTGFCDFDSDGELDFYTVNGHVYPQVEQLNLGRFYHQGVSFYRDGGEAFEDVSQAALPPDGRKIAGRGSALLDYDKDGDMDLAVNCIDDHPLLLENTTPQKNWLQVQLKGTSAQTYGVRVVARSGDKKWMRIVDGGSGYLSQNTSILHFGLGDTGELDELRIEWRQKEPQVITNPPMRQRLIIQY